MIFRYVIVSSTLVDLKTAKKLQCPFSKAREEAKLLEVFHYFHIEIEKLNLLIFNLKHKTALIEIENIFENHMSTLQAVKKNILDVKAISWIDDFSRFEPYNVRLV